MVDTGYNRGKPHFRSLRWKLKYIHYANNLLTSLFKRKKLRFTDITHFGTFIWADGNQQYLLFTRK